jgi:hypothetical protein
MQSYWYFNLNFMGSQVFVENINPGGTPCAMFLDVSVSSKKFCFLKKDATNILL